ncbi:MAG: hypothetical protein COA57_00070 [Flavobacteriales bacterium]|nr:MAG: hypothetical protein COA57_00070 [Flavobacteriales bacterium]
MKKKTNAVMAIRVNTCQFKSFFIVSCSVLLSATCGHGQNSSTGPTTPAEGVAINAFNLDPAPSAILDVSSTTKGILIPRMSAAERLAIGNPEEGLMVYDLSAKCFYYYSVNAWISLCTSSTSGADSDWDFTSNSPHMFNLNTGNVGIGTATPGAKLDVAGDVILGETTANSHIVKGKVTFFPSSLNPGANLELRAFQPDGRFDIALNGNTLFARMGGDGFGFGAGEFKAHGRGLNTAIGIIGTQGIVHIPRLFIAGGHDGPNHTSQLQIQRSDPSEWKTGAAYPNGANHYVITTFLGHLGPTSSHRAPLRIGAYDLSLYTGTTDNERMRITTEGNVGIGTATPSSKTEIVHSDINAGASVLRLTNETNGSSFTEAGITFNVGVPGGTPSFDANRIYGRYDGLNAKDGRISIQIRDGAGTLQNVLNIKSNRIGINTTSPTVGTALDVNGKVKVRTLDPGSFDDIVVADANGVLHVRNASTLGGGGGGGITGSGANGQVSFWNGTSSQAGDADFIWDNTNKRLGIGIATPLEKLHVNGNARVDGDVQLNGTAITTTTSNSTLTFDVLGNPNAIYLGQNVNALPTGQVLTLIPAGSSIPGAPSGGVALLADFNLNGYAQLRVGPPNDPQRRSIKINEDNLGTIEIANSTGDFINIDGVNSTTSWAIPKNIEFIKGVDVSGNPIGGNVGIGISNPQTALHVNGSVTVGLQTVASGIFSHAEGDKAHATGINSHAQNHHTKAMGDFSHAGGSGFQPTTFVVASGTTSFNHSLVTSSYTGVGAAANQSAILGGFDNEIQSTATSSVVLGGQGISATQPNTVYVPNIEVEGNGITFPDGTVQTTAATGGSTALVYRAILTQSGTSNPTVNVLENTLGSGSFTFTRTGVGAYSANYSNNFLLGGVSVLIGSSINGGLLNHITYGPSSNNNIAIKTWDGAGNQSDDILNFTSIEIRIYP